MSTCGTFEEVPKEARAATQPSRTLTDPSPCILVIDDDANDRFVAGHLVKRAGFRPAYATTTEEALQLIPIEDPTAILTDLQGPRTDGLQRVESIRARHPRIPVILMSSSVTEHINAQGLRAGTTKIVPKFDLARDLPATLRNLLELANADRQRRKVIGCVQARTAQFEIRSDPDLIPPLIDLILEDLERIRFGDGNTRIRLGVALQEALANALYHGNLEVSSDLRQEDERRFFDLARIRRFQAPYSDRKIRVTVSMDVESVRFEITDQGPGFDTSAASRPIGPEDLLSVGGRGLRLIRTFVDVVWHNPRGNQITLVKFATPGSV